MLLKSIISLFFRKKKEKQEPVQSNSTNTPINQEQKEKRENTQKEKRTRKQPKQDTQKATPPSESLPQDKEQHTAEIKTKTRFDELPLPEEIQTALKEMGYEHLTPIQDKTFQPIYEGKDVLGLAETGSGKTCACAIPLLTKIKPDDPGTQVLILVPTRELALQYTDEIIRLTKHSTITAYPVFGGYSMPDQMGRLKQGVQIIVATPGRLIDLIYNTSCINLTNLKAVVLDEADEMLNMGFIDDIKFIFSCMIHDYQTLFFSATMPEEIHQLTRNILREPVKIELNRSRRAPTSLNHQFHYIKPQEKEEKALELLNRKEVKQAIVFCNTKLGLESLHKKLKNKLSSVEYIHGGLDQNIRTIIFDKFKAQKIRFMLATDVAGRGLDFTHVSHVLNYDFPMDFESYTHRTGRTGRMGSQGQAITFITRRDVRAVYKLIERNNILPEWVGQKPDKPSKDSENYSNGPKRRYSGKKGNPKSAHNKDSAPKQSKPGKRPYKKKKKSQPSDS